MKTVTTSYGQNKSLRKEEAVHTNGPVNELSSRRSASVAAGPMFIKTLPTCSGPCPPLSRMVPARSIWVESEPQEWRPLSLADTESGAGCTVGGVGTGSLAWTRVPRPPPGAAGRPPFRARADSAPWCSASALTHPGERSWRREAMGSCQPDTGAISDSCLSQIFSPSWPVQMI